MSLKEFIKKTGKNPCTWAKDNGVQKDAVYRHLAGKRVSYETALLLSNATGGKIKAEAIYRTGR